MYTLTYVMGFVVTGAFVVLFLLLIFCQNAVRDHNQRLRRQRFPDGESSPQHPFSAYTLNVLLGSLVMSLQDL